jgi:hypothetical protein
LKVALKCSATTRAKVSPEPPAPNGTMILTGRSGQLCAWADAAETARKSKAADNLFKVALADWIGPDGAESIRQVLACRCELPVRLEITAAR